MRKATTRHKPPSRIRYEESHPVMSCRLSRVDYALLKQKLEELGISFATFVKDALGRLEAKLDKAKEEAFEQGYEQGYEDATKEHQIWYLCNVCRGRIDVSPNSEAHKAIIQYMQENRWGHRSCHEKKQKK